MNDRRWSKRVKSALRVRSLRPTVVNAVLAEVKREETLGRRPVSLMRGQPDTETHADVIEAACRALRSGRTGYPDIRGEASLRRAAANKIERENGMKYDPDREILITDGATCGLAAALGAVVDSGDEVLTPDPIYDAYEGVIGVWGAIPSRILSTIRDGRYRFDRSALESAASPLTKAILINSPWNPVGTVLRREELREIVDFAVEQDLVIICDEIYDSYLYDGARHVSPVSVDPRARERTIIVNSLSKTYAMTGWRVGYIAAPEPICSAMSLVLQQWSRGPATFVQDAAVAALGLDDVWKRSIAAEYQARRDQVVAALDDIPGVEPIVPEGGLFVMADIRSLGVSSDYARGFLLREAEVAVIHGSAYGPSGEGSLRVSFAAGGKTLETGLARLREGLLRLGDSREQLAVKSAAETVLLRR
jgi:aspartate/methionine/tyrosine aminotransferase